MGRHTGQFEEESTIRGIHQRRAEAIRSRSLYAGSVPSFVHRADERIGIRVTLDCRGVARPVGLRILNTIDGLQRVFDGLFTAFAAHSFDGKGYCHTHTPSGRFLFALSLNIIRIPGGVHLRIDTETRDTVFLLGFVCEHMRNLDETDLEILRLLAEDGRRPYSDVAEIVDLSPPAVSDRVNRLEEHGVIRRFTVDIDRSQLREGTPVLVRLAVVPGHADAIRQTLTELDAVEHVFTMANANIVFYATAPRNDVRGWLLSELDTDIVREFEVELVSDIDWNLNVGGTEFALTCAECGNTVTDEGVTTRLDGDLKQFCCPSCESRYTERYEELKEAA